MCSLGRDILVGICFKLDRVQKCRPAATFDFNVRSNYKIVPDSWTITVEQNVRFQVAIYCEHFNLIKFKMADLRPLLTSICVITGKPYQIARPLY